MVKLVLLRRGPASLEPGKLDIRMHVSFGDGWNYSLSGEVSFQVFGYSRVGVLSFRPCIKDGVDCSRARSASFEAAGRKLEIHA